MNDIQTTAGRGRKPETRRTLTVMRITSSGVGFGLTEEGETAFIPRGVVKGSGAQEGRRYLASTIDNDKPDLAPHMAVWLKLVEGEAPPEADRGAKAALLGERALGLIMQGDVWSTSAILTELLGEWSSVTHAAEINAISNRLHSAHDLGAISCARVFARGDQERASMLLWAKSNGEFLEALVYDDEA